MNRKMLVEINIDDLQDTKENVNNLIFAILEATTNNFFVTESITIDGVDRFRFGKGFSI